LPPWSEACERDGVLSTPLTPYIEKVSTTSFSFHLYLTPVQSIVISVSVCLSVCKHISETTHAHFIKQEAFEKCWAHSLLRAASHPFTRCRQRYCRAPPAHRSPQRQRQRVTEGTAMAPWNGQKISSSSYVGPWSRFCSIQPDISVFCEITDTRLVHRMVCLYSLLF